jgi:hypothetical protein
MEFINSTTDKAAKVPNHQLASTAQGLCWILGECAKITCSVLLQRKTQACQQCAVGDNFLGVSVPSVLMALTHYLMIPDHNGSVNIIFRKKFKQLTYVHLSDNSSLFLKV